MNRFFRRTKKTNPYKDVIAIRNKDLAQLNVNQRGFLTVIAECCSVIDYNSISGVLKRKVCVDSISSISKKAKISRATAFKILKELEAFGLIAIKRRKGFVNEIRMIDKPWIVGYYLHPIKREKKQ